MDTQYFLYKFSTPQRDYRYSNVAHTVVWNDEQYLPVSIEHTLPTFSGDFSEARITVTLKSDQSVALDYISHPPPYETRLRIYEVVEASEISGDKLQADRVEAHWKGRIIRPRWRENFKSVDVHCKTLGDIYFDKETNNESLHPLCRFYPGGADGRCPVNWEDFKEIATVTGINTDTVEPQVTVSIVQVEPYYTAGIMRTPDGDVRTINLHESGGVMTLSAHFPASTLQVGDTVELIAGDDLTFATCAGKFASQTEDGAAWGGWQWTPNRDPQVVGVQG